MEKLKINSKLAELSNSRISSDKRATLVHEGAALVLDCMGRSKNRALTTAHRAEEDFGSPFKNAAEYSACAARWSDDVQYFCAKKANDFLDKPTDRNDRSTFTSGRLATDSDYLRTLSAIMNEILYTVTPYLVSEIVGEMCSVVTVERGKTYTAAITSNAVIQWEDTSWTSIRSVPQDKLYAKTITLNPRPVAARAEINYYQMIGNGMTMVDTMAALAGGYAAMVMQKFTTAFAAAAANTKYIPSGLIATGYTGTNWATICQNVCKANRVRRDQLVGYGNFLALRKVLPDSQTLASAMMMQLGDEYFKNGYIMSHDGVMLYEFTPTATPATINTSLTDVFPTDEIIVAARANTRYAPMILCWEDNGEATLNLTPGDDVMTTGRIEVAQTASLAIAPAFASRIGLISSIA